MAHVVVFHHVLGLTPGIRAWADELSAAGHTVTTPDLFEGRTFDSIEAGMEYVQQIGFGTVGERGAAAVEGLPQELVYVGVSLGVIPAQMLTQTRPGAQAAVFVAACLPLSEFGGSWPAGVRAEIHGTEEDPFFVGEGDVDAARDLVKAAPGSRLYLYPGKGHLFIEPALPDYDAQATRQVIDTTLDLIPAT